MNLLPPALQRLDQRLPLDGLAWEHLPSDDTAPQAAVLVALSDEPAPQVLLGRRAQHLRNHPGEVAFPGGKREPEDTSPWITAKREAREEVGMQDDWVHPLGELSPLVTRTGFEVHPCIARIPPELAFSVDRQEFDSVFTCPLDLFADDNLFRLETIVADGRERRVPHYHIERDDIWGVTAAVLAMLANLAYDAGLELERDWKRKP